MKHKWAWGIGGVAVVINVVCLGVLAWFRVNDMRQFRQVHHVHTYGGTNYTVQLLETTVGKAETNTVLIVDIRLQNPNPEAVTLSRDWFVLMDHEKEYFQPLIPGTITIPAHGLVEKEILSFAVPDEALAGMLALELGRDYFAMVKSPRSFTRSLRKGQFLMFRQPDW